MTLVLRLDLVPLAWNEKEPGHVLPQKEVQDSGRRNDHVTPSSPRIAGDVELVDVAQQIAQDNDEDKIVQNLGQTAHDCVEGGFGRDAVQEHGQAAANGSLLLKGLHWTGIN